MPTLWRSRGFTFFIVMSDCDERPHVHVVGGTGRSAKIWLEPSIELAVNRAYTPREIARIVAVARDHRALLKRRWNEECHESIR